MPLINTHTNAFYSSVNAWGRQLAAPGTAPDPILNRFGMALGLVFVGLDITKSKKSTATIIVLKLLFAALLDKLA